MLVLRNTFLDSMTIGILFLQVFDAVFSHMVQLRVHLKDPVKEKRASQCLFFKKDQTRFFISSFLWDTILEYLTYFLLDSLQLFLVTSFLKIQRHLFLFYALACVTGLCHTLRHACLCAFCRACILCCSSLCC